MMTTTTLPGYLSDDAETLANDRDALLRDAVAARAMLRFILSMTASLPADVRNMAERTLSASEWLAISDDPTYPA